MGWTVLAQPVNFRIRVPELLIFSKRKTEKDRNSEVCQAACYPKDLSMHEYRKVGGVTRQDDRKRANFVYSKFISPFSKL